MTEAHQQWDIVSSVGLTALFVSAARAAETERENPLIRDQYASAFVEASGATTPYLAEAGSEFEQFSDVWDSMVDYMALRTKYFDQHLEQAGTPQVVVLASGLDTRAFRLAVPETTKWFEVDQPKVLEFKQDVLDRQGARAVCEWHPVGCDLRDDWVSALRSAGFDPSLPTAWLAEGLLIYLPPEAEERLFANITELSAPGSVLEVEDAGAHCASFFADDEQLSNAGQLLGVNMRDIMHLENRGDFTQNLRSGGWLVDDQPVTAVEGLYDRHVGGDQMRGIMEHARMVQARVVA